RNGSANAVPTRRSPRTPRPTTGSIGRATRWCATTPESRMPAGASGRSAPSREGARRDGTRAEPVSRDLVTEDRTMTKYLISFPGSAMDISDEDMGAVGEAARAVIREAKDAGVYVFGGGISEDVAPLMVAADGTVTNETYPQTKEFDGGFCVLELPSREAAVQ